MKAISLTALLVVAGMGCARLAFADAQPPAAQPAPPAVHHISLANGGVSFDLPASFRTLTADEIKKTFPGGNPPQYAYEDGPNAVSVAVDFGEMTLPKNAVPAIPDALADQVRKSQPAAQILAHGSETINGIVWAYVDFTDTLAGVSVESDEYVTSFGGKFLGVNYLSRASSNANAKASLADIRRSMAIQEAAGKG